ncbi:hypothetical protein IMCC3317_05980 [Kordia antarctica]|uniref:DUF4352 domain-containing protein n=1 Tax=Kordia antarctica TaxID=1218801 RepID=A0A7L4ZEV2_9FLAO|nr:DUF4352 domain-containing protein [Kordia antarctica]QHI35252.1 hypothetical protein IMCC3317_05980 [Kordia antarctica]
MKTFITILFLGIYSISFGQEIELKDLNVEIIKINDVSSAFGSNSFNTEPAKQAKKGMTFIMVKLKLKNEGEESLKVNFNAFKMTDDENNKYEFSFMYGIGLPSKKILKLKSGKKVRRTIYFEFPQGKELNELIIGKVKYSLK